MKQYLLLDHDGVLVDTEPWYFKAGERALADIGLALDQAEYLRDMSHGLGTWARARTAGVDEPTIARQREVRDEYYREYLRTERIEIPGVRETLAALASHVRMAIVTTAKRSDFDLIHEHRDLTSYVDFVLTREDYIRRQAAPRAVPDRTGALRSRRRSRLGCRRRHRLRRRPQRVHSGAGLRGCHLSDRSPR